MNDPTPDATMLLIMLGLLSLAAGMLTFWDIVRGKTLIPHEPRRPVPWSAAHVGLVFLVFLGLMAAAFGILDYFSLSVGATSPASTEELFRMMAVNAAVSLATACFMLLMLRALAGAKWDDLGIHLNWWREDAALGVRAFLVAAAPVYLVQWVMSRWFPSEHPVQQLLQSANSPEATALTIVAAVVVAPVCEELVFRVLLQGWLETALARLVRPQTPPPFVVPPVSDDLQPAPPPFVPSLDAALPSTRATLPEIPAATTALENSNPYRSPLAPPNAACEPVGQVGTPSTQWIAIAASSALFAAVHSWPDMVALFVFAVVLGYLYQRTHSVAAPIVMHLCLNLTSVAMTVMS